MLFAVGQLQVQFAHLLGQAQQIRVERGAATFLRAAVALAHLPVFQHTLVQRLRHRVGIGQPRQPALAVVGTAQLRFDLAHRALGFFDFLVQHAQACAVVGRADAQVASSGKTQAFDTATTREQTVAGQALAATHQFGFGFNAAQFAKLAAQKGQRVVVYAFQQRSDAAGGGFFATTRVACLTRQRQLDAIHRTPAGQAAIQLDRTLLVLVRDQQRLNVAAQIAFDGVLPRRVGDAHQVADRARVDVGFAQVAHQPHRVRVQLGLAGGKALLVLARGFQHIARLVVGGVQLASVAIDPFAQRCSGAQDVARTRE